MPALLPPKRIFLPLAAAAALAVLAAVGISAPAPKTEPDPKNVPATEPAAPAVDLAKIANDPVLRVRNARNRAQSANNLKQIALAVHNYCDANNGPLPSDILDKDGKPLLSWRVRLLPYIEEEQLYKQFKLDEPWNSDTNIQLLAKMPKIFESPRVVVKRKGYTVYQGFSGPDALFRPGNPLRISAVPDGLSNTILAVETSAAVPWTKPADIPFDPKQDLPDFGKAYGQQPWAAMLDGSVRILDLKKIKPQTLKHAIGPADGQILGKDWNE